MNEETDSWGQNLEEFTRRLGNTAVKERVENMYFTYLFVLRAVLKAGPLLESVDYSTGCQDQDVHTKSLMQHLVSMQRALSQWLCNGFGVDPPHFCYVITLQQRSGCQLDSCAAVVQLVRLILFH